MKKYFKDKVVIITGSSTGIGKQLSLLLGNDEAKIVINARSSDKLKETENELKQLGHEVRSFVGDISEEKDCKELIDYCISEFGRLDVLVNNAGVSMRGKMEELNPALIKKIFDINALGPIYLALFALPHIKKSQGSIVFISSLAALKGLPLISVYGSAKMALTALAETLYVEHKGDGVHVGIVYVGYTEIQSGKTALDANGKPIELEARQSFFVTSTSDVAKKIRKHIYLRQHKTSVGFIGGLYRGLVRFFPRVMTLATHASYKRLKSAYK